MVGQPEVDHFRKIQGLKGVDVDVLALVENQFGVGTLGNQAIVKGFGLVRLDVVIIEPVDQHDATLDVFDRGAVVAFGPKGVVIPRLPILGGGHHFEVNVVGWFNFEVVG